MDTSQLLGIEKNANIPELSPGDTVKVHTIIVEGGKERIQVFQGTVLKVRHGNDGGSFTVRRVSYGIGVERTFLNTSPRIDKVDIMRRAKVRRAKLYYLRGRSTKASRLKEVR